MTVRRYRRRRARGLRRAALGTAAIGAVAAVAGVGLIGPASGAPSGAETAAACGPRASLLAFTDQLSKTTFEGTDVGGLSALALTGGGNRAYSLVDNQAATPARFYTLRLALGHGALRAEVLKVTTLRTSDGQPFAVQNLDGEGMALLPGGQLLVSSETEPSIRRFSRGGELLGELPVPDPFRVAPAGRGRTNLTLESLTLSPSARDLYTANEASLTDDGPSAEGAERVRILRYAGGPRHSWAPGKQFHYRTEPGQAVTEMAALSGTRLLVLERGFVAGQGNTVRVYEVDVAKARDVSGEASLARTTVPPLAKQLVVDLGACPPSGATNPGTQANPLLDNFESLALGRRLGRDRRVLYLQSDDNFGATQVTRIVALSVRL